MNPKKLFELFKSNQVGTHIGQKLLEMSDLGFSLDKFHLVGHSLGAHLCGQIGRTTRLSKKKVLLKRITGLDPAGPFWSPWNPFLTALNAFDAEFVDIIHTDRTNLGTNEQNGHADFWPNGGKYQPGCPRIDFSYDFAKQSKFFNFFISHFR